MPQLWRVTARSWGERADADGARPHAAPERYSRRAMIDVQDPQLEELLDPAGELVVLASGLDFTEGPAWREPDGYLVFTDVPMDVIYRWDPTSAVTERRRPSHKSNGLAYDGAGRLLACEHVSSSVSRTDQNGRVAPLASHWEGRALNSPNDVAAARSGAVYFTDPPDGRSSERWGLLRPREIDFQGVYVTLPGSGETVLLARDFIFPNGICLSPDERTLYVNDTARMQVRAFDVRADATTENERLFIEQPGTGDVWDGAPDGMACDEHGNLWATGPHGIWVVSPQARVLGIVHTPKFASNLCFGGAGWSDVYITMSDSICRLATRTRGARDAHVVQGDLQRIADALQVQLDCGRVTVRVDDIAGDTFAVKAEACAPGVAAIAAHRTSGVRESETFRWIARERRVLVQDDIALSPITPVPALLERYGARAQLLSPVVVGGEVTAIISVHETRGVRNWRKEEVSAAARAAADVAAALG
jgi:gluconolactonase